MTRKSINQMDYKKYSLEQLSNWVHDAMSAGEATPQEIYDVIVGVVKENYECYKKQADQANKLLSLLNGFGKSQYDNALDIDLSGISEYEPSMPPWGHSDLEYLSCDRDDKSPECRKSWNDFWEDNSSSEENGQSTLKTPYMSYQEAIKSGYEMTADGFWIGSEKNDLVNRWVLPVQVDGLTGECYINLPDDLLERAGLQEGSMVHWIDRKDGSFELRKVNGTK